METPEISNRIEAFVRAQFRVADDDPRFDRDVDLFEGGFVDSIGVVELLAFIGEEFDVEIPEGALMSDEFTTIAGIGQIVSGLISDPAGREVTN
jgi:acyl carrier protein